MGCTLERETDALTAFFEVLVDANAGTAAVPNINARLATVETANKDFFTSAPFPLIYQALSYFERLC